MIFEAYCFTCVYSHGMILFCPSPPPNYVVKVLKLTQANVNKFVALVLQPLLPETGPGHAPHLSCDWASFQDLQPTTSTVALVVVPFGVDLGAQSSHRLPAYFAFTSLPQLVGSQPWKLTIYYFPLVHNLRKGFGNLSFVTNYGRDMLPTTQS